MNATKPLEAATKPVPRGKGAGIGAARPEAAPAATRDLSSSLSPAIRRELATLGALDTAIARESHPAFAVMFHDLKSGHQASAVQLFTLLRMSGATYKESGPVSGYLRKAELFLTQLASPVETLKVLRGFELELLADYRRLHDELDGLPRRALETLVERTERHGRVLQAHIAKRTGDEEEARKLPLPLRHYLASEDDRACMRCMLDRPGSGGALERQAPYTYVCAGCHDDVRADLPVDLQSQLERWTHKQAEDLVIQRALGRPSRLAAYQQL